MVAKQYVWLVAYESLFASQIAVNLTSRQHPDIWNHPGHYAADPYT